MENVILDEIFQIQAIWLKFLHGDFMQSRACNGHANGRLMSEFFFQTLVEPIFSTSLKFLHCDFMQLMQLHVHTAIMAIHVNGLHVQTLYKRRIFRNKR